MNFKQIKAIEQKNKEQIKRIYPSADDFSGVYILTRTENEINYAYIGQSIKVLTRLAQHLSGYSHIDLSIKKHGLYDTSPNGWKIETIIYCNTDDLDSQEQLYIKQYALRGYQLRNKTVGGQGKGKVGLDNYKANRGYFDGLKQGYKNAQNDISKLFEKNLIFSVNGNTNKNKEKAFNKFKEFLKRGRE